ncbi:unnamed protein product [Notodromas monacha]|uniref:SAGA-associated factor 11 n=1 Tax=Notodromas monacha TaxID=399045 RepID=A0A7R9BF53_9CRUS|nr:unnamed protein product [Notodromas monacha]CAG0913678.1 unnamed protein product [Notodromas monacha]
MADSSRCWRECVVRSRASGAGNDDDERVEEAVVAVKEDTLLKDSVAEWIFWWLLDDVVLGYAFDVHRLCATGMWQAIEGVDEDDADDHQVVDDPQLDIFGRPLCRGRGKSGGVSAKCPQCRRMLQACRLAPHLEKCMGMGRHCWRVASRRITSAMMEYRSSGDEEEDDNNNNDEDGDGDRCDKDNNMKCVAGGKVNGQRRDSCDDGNEDDSTRWYFKKDASSQGTLTDKEKKKKKMTKRNQSKTRGRGGGDDLFIYSLSLFSGI